MRRQRGFAMVLLIVMGLMLGSSRAGLAQERLPLVIEVITREEQTAPAAKMQTSPRVLLYHTHTWEAYEMTEDATYTPTETWRTKDERYNMVRIGQELKNSLEELGFEVVHDQTAFEPPTLSSAYTRSLQMLEARFAAGETYDYILDIHQIGRAHV